MADQAEGNQSSWCSHVGMLTNDRLGEGDGLGVLYVDQARTAMQRTQGERRVHVAHRRSPSSRKGRHRFEEHRKPKVQITPTALFAVEIMWRTYASTLVSASTSYSTAHKTVIMTMYHTRYNTTPVLVLPACFELERLRYGCTTVLPRATSVRASEGRYSWLL